MKEEQFKIEEEKYTKEFICNYMFDQLNNLNYITKKLTSNASKERIRESFLISEEEMKKLSNNFPEYLKYNYKHLFWIYKKPLEEKISILENTINNFDKKVKDFKDFANIKAVLIDIKNGYKLELIKEKITKLEEEKNTYEKIIQEIEKQIKEFKQEINNFNPQDKHKNCNHGCKHNNMNKKNPITNQEANLLK